MLLILPNITQKDITPGFEQLWLSIQNTLSSHKINIPIYFTVENEQKLQLHNELSLEREERQKYGESYNIFTKTTTYFQVNAADPQIEDTLELSVLYGVLKTNEEIRNSDKNLILITASYDYLSIAPGMGGGINTASGVLAVYDLSKLFAQLLDDSRLKDSASYDLMFILTPGSFLNYEPSAQFIESLNPKIKEKIKFILCLDSIAYNNTLTMHMGNINPMDKDFAKESMIQLKKVSNMFDRTFTLTKKSTPSSFHEWEHLRYSDSGFFSGTLTSSNITEFER